MGEPSTKAWICPICGYIHYGSEPPDECPLCGAAKEVFEPYIESVPVPTTGEQKKWRCTVCDYIHTGDEPPDFCPVCGASRDFFEPYVEPEKPAELPEQIQWNCPRCGFVHAGAQPPDECPECGEIGRLFEKASPVKGGVPVKIVIIGAGVAGVSAAEAIRRSAANADVLMLSNEAEFPYARINLTRYLAGEVQRNDLYLHPENWYPDNKVTLRRNCTVQAIHPAEKRILLAGGEEIPYDKLVLANGAHPFTPPFAGIQRRNVFTLRTLKDADDILAASQGGKRCICIGGGLLGLEAAGGLARKGAAVTVVESLPWLLPRQLNEAASRFFQEQIKSIGLTIFTGAQTKELAGDEFVRAVALDDGTQIPADLVVVSAGVRANIELAKEAGLKTNLGILVDDDMKTSDESIFAGGDVAEHRSVLYGTWAPSQGQGGVAGMNAAGRQARFTGVPRANTLKVLGYDVYSIGEISAVEAADLVFSGTDGSRFYWFLFRQNRLAGAILLGDISLYTRVKKTVENQADCSAWIKGNPTVTEIQQRLRESG